MTTQPGGLAGTSPDDRREFAAIVDPASGLVFLGRKDRPGLCDYCSETYVLAVIDGIEPDGASYRGHARRLCAKHADAPMRLLEIADVSERCSVDLQ